MTALDEAMALHDTPPFFIILFPALLTLFGTAVAYFLIQLWRVRSIFKELQNRNLPMPTHNMIWGHLLAVKPTIDGLPKDAHPCYMFGEVSRKFSGLYYLDLWPFSPPFLMVTSATAAAQATQHTQTALNRPLALQDWFLPITGGPTLFDMPEAEWKSWRALFNPGFSNSYLTGLIPQIVEETLVYRDVLSEHARKGDIFRLDTTTLWFTFDLIGRITMDARLHSQRSKNPLASALISQVQWKGNGREINPFQRWHPIRPFILWYNSRQMDLYIGKELDKRYDEYKANPHWDDTKPSKSVVDLAIQSYMADEPAKDARRLDRKFRTEVTRHIRLFLFAGNDTTSSTICYTYYLLSKSAESRARIRKEHDSVFGTELPAVPSLLLNQPHLINQLPYTTAVLKESMRLFPGASSMRQGIDGINIVDEQGNQYPTGGTMIWILHQALHRNPAYWKRPNEFIPERWLVGPEDPLYPVKGAWRPFEYGPRNCIGQGLVMLELRVVLLLTAREFDIQDAYADWDRMHPTQEKKNVDGERAYQIETGGAHPANRFPCRVFSRK